MIYVSLAVCEVNATYFQTEVTVYVKMLTQRDLHSCFILVETVNSIGIAVTFPPFI